MSPSVNFGNIFFCSACRGSLAPVNVPRPPNWKLAVSCSLTACSVCKRCSSVNTYPRNAAFSHASSCSSRQHSQSYAALQRAVDVSLFCSTLNVRQVSMFRRRCRSVLGHGGESLGTNSELPHRCRESCDFSFAERQKSS